MARPATQAGLVELKPFCGIIPTVLLSKADEIAERRRQRRAQPS